MTEGRRAVHIWILYKNYITKQDVELFYSIIVSINKVLSNYLLNDSL